MERGYLIGLDVGGTNIKLMITDSVFHVVGKSSIPTQYELGYEKICSNIIVELESLFKRAEIQSKNVLAIGMGLPGLVDYKKNETIFLPRLGWDGFNPCQRIADYYHTVSYIDNDANVNALGEYYFGMKDRYKNMIFITIGTGIGCAVFVEGQILRGKNNVACELGHMTVTPSQGIVGACGLRGCLESYCSGTAMKNLAEKKLKEYPNSVLHRLVKENGNTLENHLIDIGVLEQDPACLEVYEMIFYYLAIGIGNMIKIFNPEIIVVGGGVSNAGDIFLKPLNEKIKENLMHPSQWCEAVKAEMGPESGVYGCISLVAQNLGLRVYKQA